MSATPVRHHRALIIWQRSMELFTATYALAELETLFDACEALGYVGPSHLAPARGLSDEVRRMSGAMIMRLRAKKQAKRTSD